MRKDNVVCYVSCRPKHPIEQRFTATIVPPKWSFCCNACLAMPPGRPSPQFCRVKGVVPTKRLLLRQVCRGNQRVVGLASHKKYRQGLDAAYHFVIRRKLWWPRSCLYHWIMVSLQAREQWMNLYRRADFQKFESVCLRRGKAEYMPRMSNMMPQRSSCFHLMPWSRDAASSLVGKDSTVLPPTNSMSSKTLTKFFIYSFVVGNSY